MRNSFRFVVAAAVGLVGIGLLAVEVNAQEKSKVEKALSYKPVQRNVAYDIPSRSEIEQCKLERTLQKFKKPGFVVYDATGRILRLFFDVNRDNNLDSWSYYKDGIEVYRDIDTDFDGRADEFRWMGSTGTRHGVDEDKNGTIDRWERISASELAEEVFHAVRTTDTARFKKLVIDSSELKSLKLGDMATKSVATSVREANSKFESFANSQKAISSRSNWTQFGSTRPSLVPTGQSGIEQDLIIFDHAAGVFENNGKFGQISLGTIVEIEPGNWRVLELPELVGEGQVVKNGGLFYPNPADMSTDSQIAGTSGPDSQGLIKLFEQYENIEKKLKSTRSAAAIAKLEKDRAELFIKLAQESPDKDEKKNWVRQLADTVTSSYQTDSFPKGLEFLDDKIPTIEEMGLSSEVPYIVWRMIYSRFFVGHQHGDRRVRNKANERYNDDLKQFAKDYPKSSFAADALFQLGLTAEVTERDDIDQAIGWYTKCKKSFPQTDFGKKAAGALVRLTSEGKPLPFTGKTINGNNFSLQSSQLKGKIVILHFWETECVACIEGFEELQRLGAKYKSDLQIVGANLDGEVATAKRYLSRNRSVNWPQLYAPGGPEKSPLAMQLGIATLPMTLLLDHRGNLVEGNISVDDLDREIQRLIRRAGGSQANLRKPTR